MNVDILGISELKWTGMGEFNSDDHYVYYGSMWAGLSPAVRPCPTEPPPISL